MKIKIACVKFPQKTQIASGITLESQILTRFITSLTANHISHRSSNIEDYSFFLQHNLDYFFSLFPFLSLLSRWSLPSWPHLSSSTLPPLPLGSLSSPSPLAASSPPQPPTFSFALLLSSHSFSSHSLSSVSQALPPKSTPSLTHSPYPFPSYPMPRLSSPSRLPFSLFFSYLTHSPGFIFSYS